MDRTVRRLAPGGGLGCARAIHVSFCYDNRDPDNVRNRLNVGDGALNDVGCYAVAVGTTAQISVPVPFNQPPDRAARLLIDDGSVLSGSPPKVETFDPVDQYQLQAESFSHLCLTGGTIPMTCRMQCAT